MRFGLHGILGLAAAAIVSAHVQAQPRADATPPEADTLARLNLRSEWSAFLPLQSGRDGVARVQVVDRNQVFAQTTSNLLVAIDAVTGTTQWSYRFPATHVAAYPVGTNANFVFAVNVSRLMCFHRLTGVVEFDYELPGAATAGPVADDELVFVTVNGTRLLAYTFPAALKPVPRAVAGEKTPATNTADELVRRYGTAGRLSDLRDEEFTKLYYPTTGNSDLGVGANQYQYTPSLAALPSVTPPYTLTGRGLKQTPALSIIPSLRQPYQFKPEYLQYNQQTPSIMVLPPSVAQAAILSNFRPRGIEPTLLYTFVSGRRFLGQPVLTDTEAVSKTVNPRAVTRVWQAAEGAVVEAFDKRTARPQVLANLQDDVASPMAGPLAVPGGRVLGFVGLRDGSVTSLSLDQGGLTGPRFEWRASIGGYMNHKPVAAADAVFASGERSGTAKIDVATGTVVWRSPKSADQFLAANDEFVYLLDRSGVLGIYDRVRATDAATGQSLPLATLDMGRFDIVVQNPETDRVFLAAENGLIVCVRDASAKYVRPVRLAPPPPAAAPNKDEAEKAPPPPVN